MTRAGSGSRRTRHQREHQPEDDGHVPAAHRGQVRQPAVPHRHGRIGWLPGVVPHRQPGDQGTAGRAERRRVTVAGPSAWRARSGRPDRARQDDDLAAPADAECGHGAEPLRDRAQATDHLDDRPRRWHDAIRPELQDHRHGDVDRFPSRAHRCTSRPHLDPRRRLPDGRRPDHPYEAARRPPRRAPRPSRARRSTTTAVPCLPRSPPSAAALAAERAGTPTPSSGRHAPAADGRAGRTAATASAAVPISATMPIASMRAPTSWLRHHRRGQRQPQVVAAAPSQAPAAGARRRPSITRARGRAPGRGSPRRSRTPRPAPRRSGTARWPLRQSTIRAAMTGPTPGSPSSSLAVAVLRSMIAGAAPRGLPSGLLGDAADGRRRIRVPRHPDDDLLAVDEDPGEVDRVRRAAPRDAAGLGDRIRHPRRRAAADQSGAGHQPGDVHDDRRGTALATGAQARRRAAGRARGAGPRIDGRRAAGGRLRRRVRRRHDRRRRRHRAWATGPGPVRGHRHGQRDEQGQSAHAPTETTAEHCARPAPRCVASPTMASQPPDGSGSRVPGQGRRPVRQRHCRATAASRRSAGLLAADPARLVAPSWHVTLGRAGGRSQRGVDPVDGCRRRRGAVDDVSRSAGRTPRRRAGCAGAGRAPSMPSTTANHMSDSSVQPMPHPDEAAHDQGHRPQHRAEPHAVPDRHADAEGDQHRARRAAAGRRGSPRAWWRRPCRHGP